jgi:serine/threonine protein kinase
MSRHQRVRALFLEALEAPTAARDELLRRECGSDEELRAEVESLIQSHVAADSFLDSGAVAAGFSVAEALARSDELCVGPYVAQALIGDGGSSLVYRARDSRTGAQVALKLLRPGALSPEAIEELLAEAEVLRRLEHPGIVRCFDSGQAQVHGAQSAFLAMELVLGSTLSVHVRSGGSTTRETLELLVRVARAVHHIHERGSAHNDLKPDNILVDGTGQPKLIDFGSARRLDRADDGRRAPGGTPRYSSPERRRGDERFDGVASDVFSLGAITYELLTGESAVRDGQTGGRESLALNATRTELRGDLDIIVRHALELDPSLRSRSAAFFADELERYLAGDPVLSPRPSMYRRLAEFGRANRVLVGGLASTALALLLGIGGTMWALQRAREARDAEREQRQLAEANLEQARNERKRAVNSAMFLGQLFRALNNKSQAGSEKIENMLVAASKSLPPALEGADEVQFTLHQALGIALADVGRHELALEQLQLALEVLDAEQPDQLDERANLLINLAELHRSRGDPGSTLDRLEEAEQLMAQHPSIPESMRLRCMITKAGVLVECGNYGTARELIGQIRLREAAKDARTDLKLTTLEGRMLNEERRFEETIACTAPALETSRQLTGERSEETAELMGLLGNALSESGNFAPAEELLEQTLEVRRQQLGERHPRTLQSMHNFASLLAKQGRLQEALELQEQVARGRAQVLGPLHPRTLLSRNNYASQLQSAGRLTEALAEFRAVLEGAEKALPENHWQRGLYHRNLGVLLHVMGATGEARREYEACLAVWTPQFRPEDPRLADVRKVLALLE